jgi:hypothetical protein
MHYLDIHVSVDKVLKTNNIVLHVFTNTTSLLTLLNEKNYWFIYNNMIIIYNHTKVLYFMRLWEMIIYNICMHKTIFCTNIYIFYNIVRRMIARGFSLTVLFTPIKPPWFGDDPCRGRFIGLPGVMCELCPCPCCEEGSSTHCQH